MGKASTADLDFEIAYGRWFKRVVRIMGASVVEHTATDFELVNRQSFKSASVTKDACHGAQPSAHTAVSPPGKEANFG